MIGKSIFMHFHEQGMGLKIGGYYTPENKTDEEMIARLLNVVNQESFGERDGLIIIDHTKLQAMRVLDIPIDKEITNTLRDFFPEALEQIDRNSEFDTFVFLHYNGKANEFIWNNRKHKEIQQHLSELLQKSSEEYLAKRKALKDAERAEQKAKWNVDK